MKIADLFTYKRKKTPAKAESRDISGMAVRDQLALLQLSQLSGGVALSDKGALALSAFYGGTDLISNHLALMPLEVLIRKNGRIDRDTTSIQHYLLNKRPNNHQNAFNFRKALIISYLIRGNGYALIIRNPATNRPEKLIFMHPDKIQPYIDEQSGEKYYRNNISGDNYSDYDMIHLMNYSLDGITGLSIIKQHSENLSIGRNSQMFANNFYEKGANVGGVVEVPNILEPDSFERMKVELEAYRGNSNAHKLMLLEGGAKYNKIGIPPEDAQFIETRRFTTQEIARILNMPLHKLKDLSGATYSNVELLNTEYVQDCLLPIAENLEQELTYKLFTFKQQETTKVNQNFSELLRGDITARTTYYKELFNMGALNINEIRNREGENSIVGGDTHFLPANNLAPLSTMTNQKNPNND